MNHKTKTPHTGIRHSAEKIRTTVSPIFQIVLIVISLSITLGLLYQKSTTFDSREKLPPISAVTPAIIKEFGGFIQLVSVGLLITRFDNFNMTTKDFTFDGILWFQFDPGTISVETIDKFSFDNGTIIQKSPPNLQLADGKLTVQYNIRVRFTSELDYSTFPLDTHRISLMLANRSISPREVNFQVQEQNFNITTDVSTTGWDEYDRIVRDGFIEIDLNTENATQKIEYPAVLFEVDYVRNSIRYALSILLPLALIFYVMLFSISLPITTAISITAAGITAILAYRFVIENLSPRTGFFMLSDYLFFLFLGTTICVFILNVAETTITIPSRVKQLFILLLHTAILIATLYLFLIR